MSTTISERTPDTEAQARALMAQACDELGWGAGEDDVAVTNDTLADFIQTHGAPHETDHATNGLKVYRWNRLQLGGKGSPRVDLRVSDFGAFRAAVKM